MVTILLASTYAVMLPSVKPVEAQAQQFPREERNWEYVNKDAAASNYNPQTQINKGNVHLLELKWMWPFPDAAIYSKNQIGVSLLPGTDVPPLIVDGIVYLADNNKNVIAINAETGKTIWINEYKVDLPELAKTLPISPSAGSHIHAINYVNGWILVTGFGCSYRAVDALTGKDAWTIKDMCLNVPGNGPDGLYSAGGSHPPSLYKNILIAETSGGDGNWGGRTFMGGYDISTNPPKLVWRTFLTPPAEGDRDWALRDCDKGWFFSEKAWKVEGKLGLSCEEVRRVCQECLLNDWGVPKHPFGTVSNTWGQITVDEETGIAYFGTGNPTPSNNLTWATRGPLLYSSSIVALDARTGKMVWWFQVQPHGPMSDDCSWATTLMKARIDGQERKVIQKGCKTGAIMVILDAATGKPLRVFRTPDHEASGAPTPHTASNDPRNLADMTKPWCGYPDVKKTGDLCLLSPDRGLYTDNAWDGKTSYLVSTGEVRYQYIQPIYTHFTSGARTVINPPGFRGNHTVYAWDIDANKPKWGYFIDGVPARGAVVVSGGVAYWAAASGTLYGFDADTGKVLINRYHGQQMGHPTIGMTAGGKTRLFATFGGKATDASRQGGYAPVPGALVAYGLPDKIPEPQVITKEVVKEVVKEVPKEVVKEVVKEVIKEVPKEVIKEVPKEVTKTVTVETIGPVTYGAIGVAVVALVVAGVVFTRRKNA